MFCPWGKWSYAQIEALGLQKRMIRDSYNYIDAYEMICKKARSMFFREINEELKISFTIPQYADELFSLTDSNRSYLKQWLPWLDAIQDASDTRKFIELQLLKFHQGEALHETIFYNNKIAGVLGFNQIDSLNGIGYLGYWLGEAFTGKGIMTFAVKDLVQLGFDYLPIQKIDVRCAVENKKKHSYP